MLPSLYRPLRPFAGALLLFLAACQPQSRAPDSQDGPGNGLLRPIAPSAVPIQTARIPNLSTPPGDPLSMPASAAPISAPLASPPSPAPLPIAPSVPVANPATPVAPNAWRAEAGATLDQVLYSWAKIAGWEVVYDANYLYPLSAGGTFAGTFEEAVASLLSGFAHASPPIVGKLYTGNKVLVITAQETE